MSSVYYVRRSKVDESQDLKIRIATLEAALELLSAKWNASGPLPPRCLSVAERQY